MQRVELIEDPEPWDRARREGWEGVIAKRRGSPYEHRRSKHWLKMKIEASQEFVVGGFTDPQGARVGLGALLVGYYDGDDFVFAGKIGTGFDTKLLLDLRATSRRDRNRQDAVHERHGPAPSRPLGSTRDRRAGRVHRVDGARKAPASATARRPHRQEPARCGSGAAVITHPEKVLFPDDGITKGELAAYYEAIAPVMLPHLRGRPVTMERYPAGIGRAGILAEGRLEGISRLARARRGAEERRRRPSSDHHRRAVAAVDGQPEHDHAPRLVIARSGSESSGRLRVRSRSVRRRRRFGSRRGDRRCAISWRSSRFRRGSRRRARKAFTSSSRSTARRRWARWRGSPTPSARSSSSLAPDALTQEFNKVDRRGRIYVDTGRNGYHATFAAAYTVRARRGAPVSAPCTWKEVERGEVEPATFTVRNILERVQKIGDVWGDLRQRGTSLKRPIELVARMKEGD